MKIAVIDKSNFAFRPKIRLDIKHHPTFLEIFKSWQIIKKGGVEITFVASSKIATFCVKKWLTVHLQAGFRDLRLQ